MIRRLSDGAFIPIDEANADYRQYLAWAEQGNRLQQADQPSAAELNAPILMELAARDAKVIRALVEGDTVRIEAHKAKQAELRARLVTP